MKDDWTMTREKVKHSDKLHLKEKIRRIHMLDRKSETIEKNIEDLLSKMFLSVKHSKPLKGCCEFCPYREVTIKNDHLP